MEKINKELVKYFVEQCKEEIEEKKNNGPITITADQMWKYSGKIEEEDEDCKNMRIEEIRNLKAQKRAPICRKEYFREYWQRYKLRKKEYYQRYFQENKHKYKK